MLPQVAKLKILCFPWRKASMLFHQVPLNCLSTHRDLHVAIYLALYTYTEHTFSRLSTTYSYFPWLSSAQEQTEYRWLPNSKHKNDNLFFFFFYCRITHCQMYHHLCYSGLLLTACCHRHWPIIEKITGGDAWLYERAWNWFQSQVWHKPQSWTRVCIQMLCPPVTQPQP